MPSLGALGAARDGYPNTTTTTYLGADYGGDTIKMSDYIKAAAINGLTSVTDGWAGIEYNITNTLPYYTLVSFGCDDFGSFVYEAVPNVSWSVDFSSQYTTRACYVTSTYFDEYNGTQYPTLLVDITYP